LYKYGSVVRIAPNELAFFTPQAFADIYSPQHKNLEIFVKTDFQNRGKDLGGLVWEEDPVRHREVAKKISPAFSTRFLRVLEPVVHEHTDYFVKRMKDISSDHDNMGVPLVKWTNWLAMDMSADLAWNEKMHQMRDSKVPLSTLEHAALVFGTLTIHNSERLGQSRRSAQLQFLCHRSPSVQTISSDQTPPVPFRTVRQDHAFRADGEGNT
jgi:hypothetical protein